MTIGERIKKVRQEKHLTQQEFADKVSVKRNTVATYEMGRSTPNASAISLICREFHVNETWLRDGIGEMYAQKKEDLLLSDPSLDDADRALLAAYIEAQPGLRKQIKELLFQTIDRMREVQPVSDSDKPTPTIDERVAAYRAELEVEEPAPENLTDEEKEILRQLRLEKSTKMSTASPSIA